METTKAPLRVASAWTRADEVRATLQDIVATIKAGGDPAAYLRQAERALALAPNESYDDGQNVLCAAPSSSVRADLVGGVQGAA